MRMAGHQGRVVGISTQSGTTPSWPQPHEKAGLPKFFHRRTNERNVTATVKLENFEQVRDAIGVIAAEVVRLAEVQQAQGN